MCMTVNVVHEISPEYYIVADETDMAILKIHADKDYNKYMMVGKGIKIVKPEKAKDNVILSNAKFNPQLTKPNPNVEVNAMQLGKLKEVAEKKTMSSNAVKIDEIRSYAKKSIIQRMMIYVTSVSRKINGKYGDYQILNVRDLSGDKAVMYVYRQFVEKLVVNKVYMIEKLKVCC